MKHYLARLFFANLLALLVIWLIEKLSKRTVDNVDAIAFAQIVIILVFVVVDVLSILVGAARWAFF